MNQESTTTPQEGSFRIRNILVPVDFSELAERALDLALRMARQFGAKTQLIHVVAPPPPPAPSVSGAMVVPLAGTPPDTRALKQAARERLGKLRRVCAERGVTASILVTESVAASPHIAIVEAAVEHAADIIVIGTHGRSGLERVLLGSVAEGVVRHSSIPVVCVPPPASA